MPVVVVVVLVVPLSLPLPLPLPPLEGSTRIWVGTILPDFVLTAEPSDCRRERGPVRRLEAIFTMLKSGLFPAVWSTYSLCH